MNGMKKNDRPKNMSLLDYLWVNYSDFTVSNEVSSENNVILTLSAILELLTEFNGISSILIIDKQGIKYLIALDFNNRVVTEQPIPSGISIKKFGRRKISLEDRNKGCELELGSEVYYILLDNNNEYVAPIDKYKGLESRTILTSIIENTIYAELKISNRNSIVALKELSDGLFADLIISNKSSGVKLSKTDVGLEANVVLENSDKFIKFALVSVEEYNHLLNDNLIDDTTMYFIKGANFFYFGKVAMCGSDNTLVLDNYYTKLYIEDNYYTKLYILDNYITKIELINDYFNWHTND